MRTPRTTKATTTKDLHRAIQQIVRKPNLRKRTLPKLREALTEGRLSVPVDFEELRVVVSEACSAIDAKVQGTGTVQRNDDLERCLKRAFDLIAEYATTFPLVKPDAETLSTGDAETNVDGPSPPLPSEHSFPFAKALQILDTAKVRTKEKEKTEQQDANDSINLAEASISDSIDRPTNATISALASQLSSLSDSDLERLVLKLPASSAQALSACLSRNRERSNAETKMVSDAETRVTPLKSSLADIAARVAALSPAELLKSCYDRGLSDQDLADRLNVMDQFDLTAKQIGNLTKNKVPNPHVIEALRELATRLAYNRTLPTHLPDGREIKEVAPAEFFEFFDGHFNSMPRATLVPIIQAFLNAQEGKTFTNYGVAIPNDETDSQRADREFQAHRNFQKDLWSRLKQASLLLRCPATGRAAKLRFGRSGNSKIGQFFFDSQRDGKQQHKHRCRYFPVAEIVDTEGLKADDTV